MILIMVSSTLMIQAYKRSLQQEQKWINDVTNELVTLQFMTSDYLIFYNQRSLVQWEIQFEKISNLVASQPNLSSEFSPYLNQIQEAFNIVQTVGDKVDSLIDADQNLLRLVRHSSVDLQICYQDSLSYLTKTHEKIQTRIDDFQKSSNQGFTVLVLLTGAILIYQTRISIRKIIHPLNSLLVAVQAIQNADYDYQIPLNSPGSHIDSGDEVGRLAFGFNQMSSQLNLTLRDLKNAIGEGKEREQLLEKILNTNPNMIYLIDHEGRFTMVNKALAENYGTTIDDLIGKNDLDLAEAGIIDQKTAQQFYADDLEVLQTQQPRFFAEEERTTPTGRKVWLQTLLVPFNQPGKSQMVLGISVDITDRILSLQAVRSSEKLYRDLFNAISDAIFIVDTKGNILNVNDVACKRLGYTETELYEMTVMDIELPANKESSQSRIERTLTEGHQTFLVHQITKNGTAIPTEVNSVVFDYQGNKAFLSICRDMTLWEQAQKTLEERESLLSEVLNSAPDMIYLINEEGVVEMANQAMANIYMIELENLIGRNIREFADLGAISQENANDFLANNAEVIETQLDVFIPQEAAIRQDGTTIWFQTSLTPFNQEGQPPKVLGISVDISERIKTENHIHSMNQILETMVEVRTADLMKANEELRSFAYSISHDLRAPLRAIDGFSRILGEEHSAQLNQEAKRYIGLLQQNAIMMGKLIEGLLEFSRKSHQEMHLQTVDPEALVKTVLEDLYYEYPQHPAEVHIQSLPSISADPLLLKQVFQNLMQNAFKFTSKTKKPQITIGCDMMEKQPVFYVKDNGSGFDMKYADRLFGVFQRLHRTEEFEGTGIGLAITKRIITRHGGTIWTEAEAGNGASFYFTLNPNGEQQNEQE